MQTATRRGSRAFPPLSAAPSPTRWVSGLTRVIVYAFSGSGGSMIWNGLIFQ